MSKVEVTFQIPEELAEKANTAAQFTEKSKDEIVVEALREHLAGVEAEDTTKRELFDQYLEGEIGLNTINYILDQEDRELERFSETLSARKKNSISSPTRE